MQTINKIFRKRGYTLLEIMLVVAIIGLLAAIAIPNFIKARKRSQATAVLQELKKIQDSIDVWALEKDKKNTDQVTWDDIKPYVKDDTPLYNRGGRDLIGNSFGFTTVGSGVRIDPTTRQYFSGIGIDFTEFE